MQEALKTTMQNVPVERPVRESASSSSPAKVPTKAEEQPVVSEGLKIPAGLPNKIGLVAKNLRASVATNSSLKPFVIVSHDIQFRRLIAENIVKACSFRIYYADTVLDPKYSEDDAYTLLKQMFTKAESGTKSVIILNAPLFKTVDGEVKSQFYKKLTLQSLIMDYSKKLSTNFVVVVLLDKPDTYPWLSHFENGGADLLDFNNPVQPDSARSSSTSFSSSTGASVNDKMSISNQ